MDTPVVDVHVHLGNWGKHGMSDDLDRLLRLFDSAGIDRGCVNCIFHGDASRGNDIVARAIARHPDRLTPVAFVTPHFPEEIVDELDRAFDEIGCRFLKIYPTYYQKPLTDPGWEPVFEWCDDRGAVIMTHAKLHWETETTSLSERYARFSKLYPNVSWLLNHIGGGGANRDQAVAAVHSGPNVYLDTASAGVHTGIEYIVREAGDGRVVYGSDSPLFDPRHQVGTIATANLPEESKRKVLGLNAMRLLGLEL